MRKLYTFICDELDELEKKAESGGMSMSDIQLMDTLLHAKKNLLKAEEMDAGGEYSGRMVYDDGRGSYRYDDGRSYARRRDSMGRYTRR